MNCPACKEPMVVLEMAQVEIDHCLSCGGIWLDEGELDLLLEGAKEKKELLSSFPTADAAAEAPRKCPICAAAMKNVRCGAGGKVVIDKCPRDHGLWFDLGELEEILSMGCLDKDNKIVPVLKEMFAKSARGGQSS